TTATSWHDFRSTWARYEQACGNPDSRVAGIGFVLNGEDRLVLFDFDHEIDVQAVKDGHGGTRARRPDGTIDPVVRSYLDTLCTYTEVSTSGRGVHALAFGDLAPDHRKRNKQGECYTGQPGCRFFTVTGHRLPEYPATIEERPAAVQRVYLMMFGPPDEPPAGAPAFDPTTAAGLSDDVLLELAHGAVNGAKFSALWVGEWSPYYASHSEADMALVTLLAFWTAGEADRIDRLFRRSGLMRTKWTEKRGASTYGRNTIARALARLTDAYAPATGGIFGRSREPVPDWVTEEPSSDLEDGVVEADHDHDQVVGNSGQAPDPALPGAPPDLSF